MERKQLSTKEIGTKYDSFARYYSLAELFTHFFIAPFRKRLLKHAYGNVLEVGIGTGANLKYYSSDCNVTGVDASKEMLAQARKRGRKFDININLQRGDVEHLPYKSKKFDCVVDTLGLCTYPHPIEALKEMKRVCKKGGKILLLEHGRSNNNFVHKMQLKREMKHYDRIGCSLVRNHDQLVHKAGLHITRRERRIFGILYLIIIQA